MFFTSCIKNNNNDDNKKGFTLLEMIVSIGVFALVAVIAVGSLVRITGLNRRAQALQAAITNVNFAVEAMTREMRFGSTYSCLNAASFSGNDLSAEACTYGDNNSRKGIAFKSTEADSTNSCNLVYVYWFRKTGNNDIVIKKSKQTACSESDSNVSEASAVPIIEDPNITITDADFSVTLGSRNYSIAKIRLAGYVGQKETEKNYFDIETAVSQRMAN